MVSITAGHFKYLLIITTDLCLVIPHVTVNFYYTHVLQNINVKVLNPGTCKFKKLT